MTKNRELPQTWPIYTLRDGRLYDDEGLERIQVHGVKVPYFKTLAEANAWFEAEDIAGTVRPLRQLKELRKRFALEAGATIVGRNNETGLIEYATGKVIE